MAKLSNPRHKWSGSLSWENEIYCLKCGLRQKVEPQLESVRSPYLLWTTKAEPGWHATKVPACTGEPA